MMQVAAKFKSALSELEIQQAGEEQLHSRAHSLLGLAESLLNSPVPEEVPAADWHLYLDLTRKSSFLKSLPDRDARHGWAQTAFQAILLSGYTLETMILQRVRSHPDRILFQELEGPAPEAWTYARIARRLRLIAGAFFSVASGAPRVAIYAENCVEGACCDMACLAYGILGTPLNVHFDAPTLASIFDGLGINIVVTDSRDRWLRLEEVRKLARQPFQIFFLMRQGSETGGDSGEFLPLGSVCARLSVAEVDLLLSQHPARSLTDVATVMFTSGSTGLPKGVSFTLYNLISKRFARAAVLPDVGENEVLLCYLPLYHTFGRYLEMMGMLFWGGTYVFSGNPSFDTLLSQMREVRPTGLISVPLRWNQIRDHALDLMKNLPEADRATFIVHEVVGSRLHWGLSAAGYLDPAVFRFFQRHGVDLCSGFGMTEATGGITMTPPGDYVDGTVGIPLPGVRIRFGRNGELEIGGPYIARYMPARAADGSLPPQDPTEEYWLPTGDIFREHSHGYLEIVDRIKDIYKNNRGQTVAPRRVEKKFENVPGIKRSFLSGDGKDYNVLLIVPDRSDPVIASSLAGEPAREYLHRIITAANLELAPYERVVNFDLLDRDFDLERGELTPKGSYCRKVIEEHFSPVIRRLYQSSHVEVILGEFKVRLPRWFFRDIGVLEDDIVSEGNQLWNRRTGTRLKLHKWPGDGSVLIGDLEYRVTDTIIDLGIFAHQPRLWLGNPELAAFCPCKAGWDLPLRAVSERVYMPWRAEEEISVSDAGSLPLVQDEQLKRIHRLCVQSLFDTPRAAMGAVRELEAALETADPRTCSLIRRRLDALARHPSEPVRCLAYRVLLLDEPMQDYSRAFPAFIESGLAFLNEESIEILAGARLGGQQLEALRQRLYSYRAHLSWPANSVTRKQFKHIFRLLCRFAESHPRYFAPVRAELASWILHKGDIDLAKSAERSLQKLNRWFDTTVVSGGQSLITTVLEKAVVFEDGIPPARAKRIEKILRDPTFLAKSVVLAFDGDRFSPADIADGGIWISRILSQHHFDLYRLGVNMREGDHYDLLLVVGSGFTRATARETVHWLTALSGHFIGPPMLPRFGACRPDLGALSVAYVSGLTTWERIREYSSAREYRSVLPQGRDWRKLFVRSMAAFFSVWQQSSFQIVPGTVSPTNVVVPEADFREASCILSLTGWRSYENTLSLIRPLVLSFYRQTTAHYPQAAPHLDSTWMFDAAIEALGTGRGLQYLHALQRDLSNEAAGGDERTLLALLVGYLEKMLTQPYVPLPVQCGVDRFLDWRQANLDPIPSAREEVVLRILQLYRFNRFPDVYRFYLYRHTYFAHACSRALEAFDRLLDVLFRGNPGVISHLEELPDLQAALTDSTDRDVFSRMVFPRAQSAHKLEIIALGEETSKHVVVQSHIIDAHGAVYTVREPVGPAEIGHLYRLFFGGDPPRVVAEEDQLLIATDDQERIVGGISFRSQENGIACLDALVVAGSLQGIGIGGAFLEDFCVRLTGLGFRMLKTDFVFRRFYARHGFHVDARWGGLVRFLTSQDTPDGHSVLVT